MAQIFNSSEEGELQFHLGDYFGPIDLLLTLIKDSEMSVMDIKLSDLTDAFIEYVQTASYVTMYQQSDFLLVASDLLKIKSAALLPSDSDDEYVVQEQAEAASKELILKELAIRREYMNTVKSAITPLEALGRTYREPSFSDREINIVVKGFDYDKLVEAYVKVMHRIVLLEQSGDTKEVEREDFTIAGQMDLVKNRLIAEKTLSLLSIFDDCIGRSELICTFLAMLELAKRQFCLLNQPKDSENIYLTLYDSTVDTSGGIVDEYK